MSKLKQIKAKHLGHAIMVTFAGASLFNISDFIYTMHPDKALAWTLAVALAAGLVVFSALLSETRWRSTGFHITLIVVAGLTAISGAIQGAAYAHAVGWPGWLMGVSMPLFGELGASLALSIYAKEQQARSMDEAQKQLSDGVRKTIIDALSNVDRAKVEAQVNRAVAVITREMVDASIHDMIAEMRSGRSVQSVVQLDTPTVQQNALENTPSTPNLVVFDTNPVQSVVQKTALELANEKRKADKLDAMRIVLGAYHQNPDASLRDVAGLVNRSPETIRNWLKDLESQGIVHVNGSVTVLNSL